MLLTGPIPARSDNQTSGPAAGPRPLPPLVWSLYLAGMALLTSAYMVGHFLGPHWLNSGPVYNLIGGSAVVALVYGAKRNSEQGRLPWYLFALGQGLFVLGDILAYNYQRFFGSELPFPSIADPFYLAFYPLLVGGLLLLIHERSDTRDRASLIDALILTVAAAALSWVYLMAPYAHDPSLSLPTQLTSIAYPMMDILVLGVVLRLAVGGNRRGRSFDFLLAGTAILLISDAIYGWKLLHGGYNTGGLLDVGWAAFYALLGASALHPSMRSLSEPAPDHDGRLTRRRLAMLTLASLTAPALIIVREALRQPLDLYVIVAASMILFALVLMRLTGIVHRHEEALRREAALRIAGEALVMAITREEIYSAALLAARSVVDQGVTACLYLRKGEEDTLIAVDSTDGDAPSLPPLHLNELPPEVRKRLSGHRVITLESPERLLCLSPLFIRDELCGVLTVLPRVRLKRAAEESLATLATEVALALQSAALTEETLYQRSEARLSSLIKNASDVICIADEDAVVRYLSPSIERMFGHLPAAIVDRRLIEIVHPDDTPRVLAFLAMVAAQPPGQPALTEFRVRNAEQGWRDVEALGTNLLSDEAIDGIVLNIRDISERKAFQAELEHQAFHDTLTGLPNRALFRNRVEHALASQRRDGLPVAVLFLDVDDFKNVNDSLGHGAGDQVLQEVGRRLEDCMRPVDTAARLGGDEFAVLIHETENEMHSIEIAHRVMSALAVPIGLDGRQVTIGTSIGIAFSDRGMLSSRDADELLRNADAAMYMAKESGKGDYQVFQPEMHAQALARLELKADLQRAMDAEEFTLRYQPIMDLARNEMVGVEALVRWEHPKRGLVPPLDFIPLMEDTGLIVPLGHQILREACRWAAHMQRECPRETPLSMAVNVSAFQLQRPEFIDDVRTVLEETGIGAGNLVLELTESVMMRDMDLSILRLKALRALGVKLAIDDFGTGYSSLNYVRQFPVDILKIDRSFLADQNPQVTELTAAIVQLAQIFKLQAVAEGIENEAQLKRLQSLDCAFGQGFHFAKPLSGEDILAMVHAQQRALSHK